MTKTKAFLQEIGARGGRTVVERYGLAYLRELGRRGGQATAGKNGHLRRIAARGGPPRSFRLLRGHTS